MTQRVSLDLLTSDQLDALYERLEAAEETETRQQRDRLAGALREVLDEFTVLRDLRDGERIAYRGPTIRPADYDRWRTVLDQTQEQPEPATPAEPGELGDALRHAHAQRDHWQKHINTLEHLLHHLAGQNGTGPTREQ